MSTFNLLLALAEAALASFVLPVLAALLARAYPHHAGRRRLVWTTLFAVLLVLPLAAIASPSLAVITLPAPAPAAEPMAVPVAVAEPVTAGPLFTPVEGALMMALLAWLCGMLWIVTKGLAGLVSLESLRWSGAPAPTERLPVPVPKACGVRLSAECPGPMTWGVLRPVIMLPDDALDWPRPRLEAALRHELAHVRARDSLIQACALFVCALYWPNPLVWRAARSLRVEAEGAADDAVIASGAQPSDYAAQLLDLAREWRPALRPGIDLAMAAPPILSERVQSILSPNALRTGATAMDAFKLTLVGGVAVGALALAHPSIAEVPAPAAAPADAPAQQAAPATPPTGSAPSAPAAATLRSRIRDQIVQNARAHADRQGVELAQQDVPAPPAPPAPPAVAAAPLPPLPVGPPATPFPPGAHQIPYNQVTDDPASPGYIGPGQPGAQHPVPAELAEQLNARKDAAAPWVMAWLPANPNGPRGPGGFHVETNAMTPDQLAELNRKLAAIGPAVDKAIKDAHIDETVQKALSAEDAKTREEVARELQRIGPLVQQAIANAHIQEQVGQRLAQIQPQIEQARKQAQERRAQAEDRVAAQLEEQAKRARERAQKDREQLNQTQQAPAPAPAPKN